MILGIDPSLRKTGLCKFIPYDKEIIFDRIIFDVPFNKSYKYIIERIYQIKNIINKFIKDEKIDIVAIETPLPQASFTSGISSLIATIIFDLFENTNCLIYGFNPSYLKFILGKKYKKHSEIIEFVKSIIKNENLSSNINKFSDDEAVAFLYAFRIAILNGSYSLENSELYGRFFIVKENFYSRELCQEGYLQRKKEEMKKKKI